MKHRDMTFTVVKPMCPTCNVELTEPTCGNCNETFTVSTSGVPQVSQPFCLKSKNKTKSHGITKENKPLKLEVVREGLINGSI